MSTSLTPLSCQGLSQWTLWGGSSFPRRRMAACWSLPPHLDLLDIRQTLLKPIKFLFSFPDILPFVKISQWSAILTLSEMELKRSVARPIRSETPHAAHSPPALPYNSCSPSAEQPCPALHAIVFHSAVLPVLRSCSAAGEPTCRNLPSRGLSLLIGRETHVTDAHSNTGLPLVEACLAHVHPAVVRLQA